MTDTIRGTLFAFFAYASYAISDAFIKAAGGSVSIFEIGFFITLFSFIPVVLGRPASEKWGQALKISHPKQVHIRAISTLLGGLSAIYAFTSLPLAEAFALIFLIPAFTTILSVTVLREQVGWKRWGAVGLGFIGILIVVRPGFNAITLAHLAGMACAFFASISVTAMRSISGKEKRITILTTSFLYNIAFYSIAMIATFKLPNQSLILLLAVGGICSGFGHLGMLRATDLASTSAIAPAQYSQIIWAVAIGIIFFNEYPDSFTLIGLVIVGSSGLMIFMREEVKRDKRIPLNRFRSRL